MIAAIVLCQQDWQIWWRSAVLISQIPTWSRDLPTIPLTEVDWETVYASGPHGYSDYPAYRHPNTTPRAEHVKDNTRTEQGDRSAEAFDTLFNKREATLQQNVSGRQSTFSTAHISRQDVKDCSLLSVQRQIRCATKEQLIVAEGDYVINARPLHWYGKGRGVDCSRHCSIRRRSSVQYWDVLQDEATQKESVSGLPMFGKSFPSRQGVRHPHFGLTECEGTEEDYR